MGKLDVTTLSTPELLTAFGDVLEELKSRGIVRSRNNPVADYSEWIVSKALSLSLQSNSNKGFDAVDSLGVRYQIKGRRLHPSNPSRQLSVIRSLDSNGFDFLVGVLFNEDFLITEAYKIPHDVTHKYARYSEHQNGHIVVLRGEILTAEGVTRIDDDLRKCV